jgi:hypothetical protein
MNPAFNAPCLAPRQIALAGLRHRSTGRREHLGRRGSATGNYSDALRAGGRTEPAAIHGGRCRCIGCGGPDVSRLCTQLRHRQLQDCLTELAFTHQTAAGPRHPDRRGPLCRASTHDHGSASSRDRELADRPLGSGRMPGPSSAVGVGELAARDRVSLRLGRSEWRHPPSVSIQGWG